MTSNTYTAVVHLEKNRYVARCLEVGTASQGHTLEKAIANLEQATKLYLEKFSLSDHSFTSKGQSILYQKISAYCIFKVIIQNG